MGIETLGVFYCHENHRFTLNPSHQEGEIQEGQTFNLNFRLWIRVCIDVWNTDCVMRANLFTIMIKAAMNILIEHNTFSD